MRPRHKAAENTSRSRILRESRARASMRPRHKAAENCFRRCGIVLRSEDASMRPRHKAAENYPTAATTPRWAVRGFNEAAA